VIQVNAQQQFHLGDIQVSAAHNSLSLDNRSVKLQPKAMAVLHYLAVHQARVISAQELMEQLWAGRIVTQGSVQKSINAIRSALAEIQPGREFIAFYSKRGYQLQVPASFNEAMSQAVIPAERPILAARLPSKLIITSAVAIGVVVLVVGLLLRQAQQIPKHHKTQLSHWSNYTRETGHERTPTPHPDNQHLAYITENFVGTPGESESHLLIRDVRGQDWQVANSQGAWFKLAWSPSGKHLAAVEVKRLDSRPLNPNFYEKANFIYTFHLFTLDLTRHQLLEKQTLSQWQGRIFSLSWWDDDTLEIVAKQGPNAGNARYRYDCNTQQLTQLEEINGAANPIASSVLNKVTALASQHGNKTQIDFLNAQQKNVGRYELDYPHLDISWIPDGSGVLAFAEDSQHLLLLYRDGKQLPIPLPASPDKVFSKARFGPAGDKIYLTQEQRSANIQEVTLDGQTRDITRNTQLNFGASYSPRGSDIVYGSVRNNELHLWRANQDQEQQLTKTPLPERIGPIKWSPNGDALFFNAGNGLYQFNFHNGTTLLLHQSSDKVEAIGLLENKHQLLFLKAQGDIKNLWALDLNNHQEKQITFGSLAGVLVVDNVIYLQYLNEPGLWEIAALESSPININPDLPANSKLLTVNEGTLYYLSGGTCRESDVMQINLKTREIKTALHRTSTLTNSTAYHPARGVLQTGCYIPEANVVVVE
jgi:DNA-binding winged helix-turn-helix (wHTH) protein